jgi:hypothetical protein
VRNWTPIQIIIMINSANYFINGSVVMKPVPVAAWSKVWVCGSSLAVIAGSNLAGGMDVCLWQMFCSCRERSVLRTDYSPGDVLKSMACVS